MAKRENTLLVKRSNVAGKVPSAGDLLLGELALNTADVILYASGTTENSILPIGWDRIHRTGDTMNGDLIINGNLTVTEYIDFTTTGTPTAISGRTYFDRVENALSYFPDTPSNDVTINIGQESVIRIYNGTGQQINNGEACHITSEQPSVSGVPSVILAIATGSTETGSHYEVSGVATHDIPNGTIGFITAFGIVRDLTITGVTEGSEIYLSDTNAGQFIYTPPTDITSRISQIGHVITTGITTAKILVEINNESAFSDLSNAQINVVTLNNASTGTREGGQMSINGGDNSLLDISSGTGVIVDNFTDANNPVITEVVWDTITGITLTSLTSETGTYIFLDENASVVQFANTTPPTESDKRDKIFLGLVGHASNTFINNIFNTPIQIVSPINQHEDLTSAIGPFSISGNRVGKITGTLELQKTAGRSFYYGGNFHTDNTAPSQLNTSALSGSTLVYAKGDTVMGPSGTTIDPNNYDPNGAGTITAIPANNNYVAHRIWHQPSQNLLVFQYGQAFYTNEALARDSFENEDFIVPEGLDAAAYVIGVIIVQDGAVNLDNAIIIQQSKFVGSGGGGGGAVDTLQSAYDNSTQPEIITDATRTAVDFRVGSGQDTDQLVTFQQNSGTINGYVTGLGDAKFNSLSGDSINIITLPTNNNSATKLLVRNDSTGNVEYRDTSSIVTSWDGQETITAGENLLAGDLAYLASGGTYLKASNTAESTSSTELRIAVSAITSGSTGPALIQGQYTTTGLTSGDKYWLGATAGTYTNIKPNGDGDIVRYIGTALDSTTFEFMPDETWIEVSSSSGPSTNPNYRAVTTSTSILNTDFTIDVTTTADTTQTLPLSTSLNVGKVINVKNSDSSSTSTITMNTSGGQLIDGQYNNTTTITFKYPQSLSFQSTGSGWILI